MPALVISKSSLVMLAWRSLLYSRVMSLMSCLALSVAFFIAKKVGVVIPDSWPLLLTVGATTVVWVAVTFLNPGPEPKDDKAKDPKRLLLLPGGHHRSLQHDGEMQGESLRFIVRAATGRA